MDLKPKQTTQSTTSEVKLSPEQQELQDLLMPFTRQFAANPPQYPRDTVQPFDPLQTAGQSMALGAAPGQSAAGSFGLGAIQDLLGGSATTPWTPSEAGAQAGQIGGGRAGSMLAAAPGGGPIGPTNPGAVNSMNALFSGTAGGANNTSGIASQLAAGPNYQRGDVGAQETLLGGGPASNVGNYAGQLAGGPNLGAANVGIDALLRGEAGGPNVTNSAISNLLGMGGAGGPGGGAQNRLATGGDLGAMTGVGAGAQATLLDPGLLNADSNPALRSYMEAATRPIQQNLMEETLPMLRSSAAGTGNFGSSRSQLGYGLASGRASQAMGDVSSRIASEGYGQGLNALGQAFSTESGRQQGIRDSMLGALGLGTQQNQIAGQLSEAQAGRRQQGIGMGMEGALAGAGLQQRGLESAGALEQGRVNAGIDAMRSGLATGTERGGLAQRGLESAGQLGESQSSRLQAGRLAGLGLDQGDRQQGLARLLSLLGLEQGATTGALDRSLARGTADTTAQLGALGRIGDVQNALTTPALTVSGVGDVRQQQGQAELTGQQQADYRNALLPLLMAQEIGGIQTGIPGGSTINTGPGAQQPGLGQRLLGGATTGASLAASGLGPAGFGIGMLLSLLGG